MAEQAGAFRKKRTNFSQISNIALTDPNLSLKAKGLYAVIQRYLTLSENTDYVIYKTTIQANCKEGKDAFQSTWNELKKAGYLKIYRKSTQGGFVYEYELLDQPEDSTESPTSGFSVHGEPVSGEATSGKPVSINKKEEKNKETSNKERDIVHSFQTTQKLLKIEKTDLFDDEYDLRSYIKTVLSTANIEGMKEDIINDFGECKNESPYSYNDFITFAADQVSLADNFGFAKQGDATPATVKYSAALEWVKAMANIYSNPNEYISIGKNRYKTIDFKQRLLQIDKYSFQNLLIKFAHMSSTNQIKNLATYMTQMLYNAAFDSGVNMSDQIDISYFQ